MEEMRNACKILIGKPERKRQLGNPKRNGNILKGVLRK
jgi:hypothetical protein